MAVWGESLLNCSPTFPVSCVLVLSPGFSITITLTTQLKMKFKTSSWTAVLVLGKCVVRLPRFLPFFLLVFFVMRICFSTSDKEHLRKYTELFFSIRWFHSFRKRGYLGKICHRSFVLQSRFTTSIVTFSVKLRWKQFHRRHPETWLVMAVPS